MKQLVIQIDLILLFSGKIIYIYLQIIIVMYSPREFCSMLLLFLRSLSLFFERILFIMSCAITFSNILRDFRSNSQTERTELTKNANALAILQHELLLKPNSWTYNFVEVSGHNLESSQTWGFRIQMFTFQPSFKPLLLGGGGGVKSVSTGEGKLLSQVPPRIRPLLNCLSPCRESVLSLLSLHSQYSICFPFLKVWVLCECPFSSWP